MLTVAAEAGAAVDRPPPPRSWDGRVDRRSGASGPPGHGRASREGGEGDRRSPRRAPTRLRCVRVVLHGAPALEGLDGRAHPTDPSATPYLRALIDDIADALGLPSPLSPGHPAPLTSPSRSQRAAERTLRNL